MSGHFSNFLGLNQYLAGDKVSYLLKDTKLPQMSLELALCTCDVGYTTNGVCNVCL